MSPESPRRLAELGLADLPPSQLGSVAESSWEWCEATGDGRYCLIWQILTMVDDWFGDPGEGAMANNFFMRLDAILRRELPGVIDAATAQVGCALAATMRDELITERNDAGDPLRPRPGYGLH